jgi:hypothetical protein
MREGRLAVEVRTAFPRRGAYGLVAPGSADLRLPRRKSAWRGMPVAVRASPPRSAPRATPPHADWSRRPRQVGAPRIDHAGREPVRNLRFAGLVLSGLRSSASRQTERQGAPPRRGLASVGGRTNSERRCGSAEDERPRARRVRARRAGRPRGGRPPNGLRAPGAAFKREHAAREVVGRDRRHRDEAHEQRGIAVQAEHGVERRRRGGKERRGREHGGRGVGRGRREREFARDAEHGAERRGRVDDDVAEATAEVAQRAVVAERVDEAEEGRTDAEQRRVPGRVRGRAVRRLDAVDELAAAPGVGLFVVELDLQRARPADGGVRGGQVGDERRGRDAGERGPVDDAFAAGVEDLRVERQRGFGELDRALHAGAREQPRLTRLRIDGGQSDRGIRPRAGSDAVRGGSPAHDVAHEAGRGAAVLAEHDAEQGGVADAPRAVGGGGVETREDLRAGREGGVERGVAGGRGRDDGGLRNGGARRRVRRGLDGRGRRPGRGGVHGGGDLGRCVRRSVVLEPSAARGAGDDDEPERGGDKADGRIPTTDGSPQAGRG